MMKLLPLLQPCVINVDVNHTLSLADIARGRQGSLECCTVALLQLLRLIELSKAAAAGRQGTLALACLGPDLPCLSSALPCLITLPSLPTMLA